MVARFTDLSRLTLVIPSYCRQNYILRQMDYWSSFEVRLIVLDGSPYPNDIPNSLMDIRRYFYQHYPVSIEKRLGKSISLVETEYIALLSDDEFFVPTALESCIKFLDENPDYSACKGRAVGFGYGKKSVYGKLVYPGLAGYHIDKDNGEARMRQHMAAYEMASLWSVQRIDVFRECMKAISSGPAYSSAAVGELQISLISAKFGKIKVLEQLMWLRSFENRNIWWQSGNLDIATWWRNSNMSDEHIRFTRTITSAKLLGNDLEEIPDEHSTANAVEVYVMFQEQKKLNSKRGKFFGNTVTLMLRNAIKRCILGFRDSIKNKPSLLATANELMVSGVRVDLDELKNIESAIRKFHQSL